MIARVGDKVVYNGGYPFKEFYEYDERFIKCHIKVGELYEIRDISKFKGKLGKTIPWYKIFNNNISTGYWIPYLCFDIIIDRDYIKYKYNLR